MTTAVCVHCGATKYGALNVCDKCRRAPFGRIDVVRSLALTDHYLSAQTLQQIGPAIAEGRVIQFDDAFLLRIEAALSKMGLSESDLRSLGLSKRE